MTDFQNLCELIFHKTTKFNNQTALNFKEAKNFDLSSSKAEKNPGNINCKKSKSVYLRSFSNQEFAEKILQFACGLKEIGFEENQTFANYSYQNPIWLIVDFGVIIAGGISVPIFHNVSRENLNFEIKDCEAKFLFTDNLDCLRNVENIDKELKIIGYNIENSGLVSFEEVLNLGKKSLEAKKYNLEELLAKIKKDNPATIIYTSGSTDKPKGVVLSHRNLISQIKDAAKFFPLFPEDVAFSFLPLAHIFERMVMIYYISCGISIYFADDIKNVTNLLKEFKPTLLTAVPRVLEKAHSGIIAKIDSANFIQKLIGNSAYQRAMKRSFSSSKPNLIDFVFDFLVYRKFRQGFGGKIRMIICGGSALNQNLENFFWNIGIKIFCGYGLTEASPVLAANCPAFFKLGTVGKAFPSVVLKVGEDGELLAKGENVMLGYYKNETETRACFQNNCHDLQANLAESQATISEEYTNISQKFCDDSQFREPRNVRQNDLATNFSLKRGSGKQPEQEWLKTGDEAEIDDLGFVKIVGRRKEIVKNSYGKFVNLAKIEQELSKEFGFLIGAIAVAQGKNFTSVLLFPDFEQLKKLHLDFVNTIPEVRNIKSATKATSQQFENAFLFDIESSSSNEYLHKNQQKNFSQALLNNASSSFSFFASQDFVEFICNKIKKINQKLDHWEQIKVAALITAPIAIESGEITPSMKLKRKVITEKFQKEISAIYGVPNFAKF